MNDGFDDGYNFRPKKFFLNDDFGVQNIYDKEYERGSKWRFMDDENKRKEQEKLRWEMEELKRREIEDKLKAEQMRKEQDEKERMRWEMQEQKRQEMDFKFNDIYKKRF